MIIFTVQIMSAFSRFINLTVFLLILHIPKRHLPWKPSSRVKSTRSQQRDCRLLQIHWRLQSATFACCKLNSQSLASKDSLLLGTFALLQPSRLSLLEVSPLWRLTSHCTWYSRRIYLKLSMIPRVYFHLSREKHID